MATRHYGVFQFNGKAWTRHDVRDGLADNSVSGLLIDGGSVWVRTQEGTSRFDGTTWTPHALPPGVDGILRKSLEGALWINRGSTIRYEPDANEPETEITLYLKEVSQPGNTTISWKGADPWHSTPDEELQYAYRLDNGDWSAFSTAKSQIFQVLPSGDHTFEVKARDRDFNEDPTPARLDFRVLPPVWRQAWFLALVAAFLVITGSQTFRVVARTRERNLAREALLAEAEEELQTAHKMQMGLMPTDAPAIKGFDITGRSVPANHVCGDFFQYFEHDDKLSICVADVTGHAMEAAIPAVMFSGVLDSQMELRSSVDDLFGRLNSSMHRNLDRRTFVCFTMGELDSANHHLRLCNGGCPYPYHFKATTKEAVELQADAYPLGVRPNTDYQVVETQLRPGDRIIFCSDGIPEAYDTEISSLGSGRFLIDLGQAAPTPCRYRFRTFRYPKP